MKSSQSTLPDSTSATSSPGSVAGPLPCGGQGSKALPESGPAPVRVSRFRALASDRDTPTSATFGPLFTASSPSADLQRCLASRLRARMDVNGSPEFALTWKDWDMPAGEPICALRASERRTGDKGCSGWPTPMAGNKDEAEGGNYGGQSAMKTVALCGWPTCSARDWKDTPGMSETGVNPDGTERKRLDMLPRVAQLAARPTPNCDDPNNATMDSGQYQSLTRTARLAAWPTARAQDSYERSSNPFIEKMLTGEFKAQLTLGRAARFAPIGPASTSCPAGTGKRGVLRPGHSRWLMGYPAAWDSCGDTAMLSCRRARRSS